MKLPYVDAIQKQAGNIDVEYVRNDECDDFAQLERFFIALDGPVRNPTNFGWITATLQRARARADECSSAVYMGITP